MTIAAELVPFWLSAGLWLCCLITLGLCARYADWAALQRDTTRYHLLFGGVIFCMVLWLLSVRVIEGLWLHFLGVTTLTLILGWRFAMLAVSVAIVLHTLLLGEALAAVSPAWLFTVAIPASVSRAVVHFLRKLKTRNLFIYMLGAGFGGGVLSVLFVALVAVPLLWMIGQTEWAADALVNWPLITLMMFPEGFINGMLVTTLTVFYPSLVKTFDDRYYLGDE